MDEALRRWRDARDNYKRQGRAALAQGKIAEALPNWLLWDYVNDVVNAREEGRPLISTWYGNGIEIFAGLGVDTVGPASLCAHFLDDRLIEQAQKSNSSSMSCGLLRLALAAAEQGIAPVPTAMVAMLQPCDGQAALSDMLRQQKGWESVPVFSLDAPYGNSDDDYRYFANELRAMTLWLEEQTGRTLTEKGLRRACAETNRQYGLFASICELQHARPAPIESFLIPSGVPALIQQMKVASPKVTLFLRLFALQASAAVKKGKGALPDERVRCYWLDIPYFVGEELWPWLAETYGATVVNSTWGEARHYTPIDLTSMDSMYAGIARHALNEMPMIRQARGTIDNMIDDLRYAVRNYQIDCVIYPGHKGHKDMLSSVGYLQEACRDLGVPLLCLTTDLCDPSFMPIEEVKEVFSQFFDAHGWEKVNEQRQGKPTLRGMPNPC